MHAVNMKGISAINVFHMVVINSLHDLI